MADKIIIITIFERGMDLSMCVRACTDMKWWRTSSSR